MSTASNPLVRSQRFEGGGPFCGAEIGRQGQGVVGLDAGTHESGQFRHGFRRQPGKATAIFQQRVGGDAAQAPTVADDGEALAAQRAHARHGLGSIEKVIQRLDADPAGATQRRFIDVIAAKGQGIAVATVEACAAHGHDGFVACCGTRRRHELASCRCRVELHQDGLGLRVFGQPVEHVGEVDVEPGAQMHHGRKADALARRAIQRRRRDGGGLHHQRDLAAPRHHRRDAGVEAGGSAPAGRRCRGRVLRTSRGRAASRMALRAAATWLALNFSCSDGPTITARVPRAPSLVTISATSRKGAQTMARSGALSRCERCTWLPMPNSACVFASTCVTGPENPPAARLRSTTSA